MIKIKICLKKENLLFVKDFLTKELMECIIGKRVKRARHSQVCSIRNHYIIYMYVRMSFFPFDL